MMTRVALKAVVLCVGAATACAAPGPTPSAGEGSRPAQQMSGESRTLTILTRAEPVSLAAKPLQGTGVSVQSATRPFNATLDIEDSREEPRPDLAEALPKLNTDTWQVFPDGRMETRYRLRPNLAWHDGTLLVAEDFVFSWRVYTSPELGLSTARPQGHMQEVLAPDERTVVIRWRGPFGDADALGEGFQALPRHILEGAFEQGSPEALGNHPYWSIEYVGLGPYRLAQWEPGALIEGTAFDGHVWGRPKIDRVTVRFSADENTALANLLAESVHLASDRAIRFEQATVLRREWRASQKGTVLLTPTQGRYAHVQFRSEFADPAALLDVRVRKALAHSVDKNALNDGLFGGEGVMTANLIRHSVPYFSDIDRSVVKYPYDVRRADQLMSEGGWTKGSDGIYANTAGDRFSVQLMNQAGVQPERETTIMLDTWRRAGIDGRAYIVPVARSRDNQERATFPGLQNASGQGVWVDRLEFLTRDQIGGPQNRWRGQNRGGWSNPEYDRLWQTFSTTLERPERSRLVVQMEKLISEQLPVIALFFNFGVSAYLAEVKGPDAGAVNDTLITWNIHEWEVR